MISNSYDGLINTDQWWSTGIFRTFTVSFDGEDVADIRFEIVPNCLIVHVNTFKLTKGTLKTIKYEAHRLAREIADEFEYDRVFILTPFEHFVQRLTDNQATLVQRNLVPDQHLYQYMLGH